MTIIMIDSTNQEIIKVNDYQKYVFIIIITFTRYCDDIHVQNYYSFALKLSVVDLITGHLSFNQNHKLNFTPNK